MTETRVEYGTSKSKPEIILQIVKLNTGEGVNLYPYSSQRGQQCDPQKNSCSKLHYQSS